jgi:hypothetical protein
MAQDFAKKRRSTGAGSKPPARKRKAPAATAPRGPTNVWRWYGAGVVTGILLCFLMYLGTLPAEPGSAEALQAAESGESQADDGPPKPRFDFYTLLPQQTIDAEVDPGEIAKARTTRSTELYLLQAGSFKQREDADRRRAELLLLGLEPKIEETNGDNGRWFRVYVGPFESRSRLSKARSLTAAQNIDTLLLKRSKP